METLSCGFLDFQEEKRKHDSESREHRDLKRSVEEVRHHRGDRKRAERDTHKERRHREEEDRERRHREEEEEPERNHRDRTSSKKISSSDKGHMHETSAVETEVSSNTFNYLQHLILSEELNYTLGGYLVLSGNLSVSHLLSILLTELSTQ